MADKEMVAMTEAEVVKALECCGSSKVECHNCPLNETNETDGCMEILTRESSDLILQQREKIEILEKLTSASTSTEPTAQNNVEHPNHYQGKHECIDVMRALFGDNAVMMFCKCNAFKYRFRADKKNGAEDIAKAEWYEDYLIKMQNRKKEEVW